jgi:hypothetical protein
MAVPQVMLALQAEKGRQMNKTSWLAVALLLCMTPMASASVAIISGSGPLGAFEGTLEYTSSSAVAGQLELNITNTSPGGSGFLVAIVLNKPADVTGVSLNSTDTNLNFLLGAIVASPLGSFDFGVQQDHNPYDFEGAGGNPNGGIAGGASGNFLFDLTGTDMDVLTTADFISDVNGDGYFLATRFKGFANGGSDKVPGTEVVPEPASVAVWGCIAMLGIPYGMYRRRKAVNA